MIAATPVASQIEENPPLICRVVAPNNTWSGLDENASTGTRIDMTAIQNSGNAAITTQMASPSAETSFRAAGCSSERACVIDWPADGHARSAAAAA